MGALNPATEDVVRDLSSKFEDVEKSPPKDSVLGLAEILEASARELQSIIHPDSSPYEHDLILGFLRILITHVDRLVSRAELPAGPSLDRVRRATTDLQALAKRVEGWFFDERRKLLKSQIRPGSWESLAKGVGIVSIGGDAVADRRALGKRG